jgi:hypothetical protein
MKIRKLHNRLAGVLLGFSLLIVAGIGFGANANAQDRYPNGDQNRNRNLDRYGDYGGSTELRQTALNAGYNEGISAGNDDRQNRRQSNYQDSNVYRRASQGYNSHLGDRRLYQRYFREAFQNGYNFNGNNQGNFGRDDRWRYPDPNNTGNRTRRGRNWDGYGDYGGSPQLRQTALNAGYNEGNKQGHKDRNRSNSNSFQSQSAYQKATQDYNSRLGDRGLYQRYFREAYENGFSDGVNGY